MCDGDSVQPPETKDRDGAQPGLKPVMFDTPSQDTGQVKGHPWERRQSSRARNVPWVPLPGRCLFFLESVQDVGLVLPHPGGRRRRRCCSNTEGNFARLWQRLGNLSTEAEAGTHKHGRRLLPARRRLST